ncbi:MAG: DUF559 domain-containing protein, partial [Sediminibacterium sp.]|nr:DUF559 domain-containing protein [Sediminibacterium sp.]
MTKNILQRGFPTTLSKYLQSKLGKIHTLDNFKERFLFATNQTPVWNDTIKGDENKQFSPTKIEFEGKIVETHNPAKFFFEELLPAYLGEYSFIQSQILPEVLITEIIETENEGFNNQQVDFYFPQAKLVIEIDGSHHDLDPIIKHLDEERDNILTSKGFKTFRITTKELGNGDYIKKIELIKEYIQLPSISRLGLLKNYKKSCEKIEDNQMSQDEIKTKLLPTAIIRFQVLLIELLTHKYLTFDEDWNFNILSHEYLPDFAELAINDLLIWIDKLWQLKNKQKLKKPN